MRPPLSAKNTQNPPVFGENMMKKRPNHEIRSRWPAPLDAELRPLRLRAPPSLALQRFGLGPVACRRPSTLPRHLGQQGLPQTPAPPPAPQGPRKKGPAAWPPQVASRHTLGPQPVRWALGDQNERPPPPRAPDGSQQLQQRRRPAGLAPTARPGLLALGTHGR